MQLELGARPGARRVLGVAVPELPLQRALRARGAGRAPDTTHARELPLVVVHEGRVTHASQAARAEGIGPGDSAMQAEAACAELVLAMLDPAADRSALRALAEALLALSPAVEVSSPDTLLLDASAAHLLADGVERGEVALAERARVVAGELGYRCRVAVASGRGPARALARHGSVPSSRVAPDQTASALAALPLESLELPEDVAERLRHLGIRDVGALARLPPATLAHRFGAAGVAAARLARGEDDSCLVPYVPETLPEESLELEFPAETTEPLLFGLKRLGDRVGARLAGRGLGATRLRVTLKLDPRGEEKVLLPLARPTAATSAWMAPLRERLALVRLGAPVTGLVLSAVEVAPATPEQLAIGDRPEAIAALETVLARLAARFGDGALFAAAPADRHRPETAYRGGAFAPPRARPASESRHAPAPGAAPPADLHPGRFRPTRLLAPPRPLVAEGEGGRLTALRVGGRAHAVLALVGPERLTGEWWSDPFDRDYYRARLDGLGDCWIYCDRREGRLFLHGFFD